MFRIAACDDSQQCLDQTRSMVNEFVKKRPDLDIVLDTFLTPFDLLDSVEKGVSYQIFLLDVVLPGITGMQVAKELRKMGVGVAIIFLTSDKSYALEAFSVGATQYLIKGFSSEEFFTALDNAIDIVGHDRRRQLVFATKEGLRHIYARNIMYTVGQRKYQDLILENGEVMEIRISNRELAEELTRSSNFVSCGSSYIINLYFVASLGTEYIKMTDGAEIKIPRGLHQPLKAAFTAFFTR
ncbi:MAG: response regulator transcription factor [Erysipelotrichaceae bacterium]|nr:response regulator transcription factor [Erysipelotrichaceae bacterium]